MKKAILTLAGLTAAAALGEGLILLRIHLDPWKLGALMESFSLTLGAFVGLTQSTLVRKLREWAVQSALAAAGLPFLMLVPYFVLALGTGTFSWPALGKLTAYIAVPTLLLLPDRQHRAETAGWRDFAAMLALAVPVAANWLEGIWVWPQDLYVFRPLFCVCVGAYGFLAIRNLEGVGYRILWRRADVVDGLTNFLAFFLLGIPLGLALGFIHPHWNPASAAEFGFHLFGLEYVFAVPSAAVFIGEFALQFVGIYLTIAIPEEFLFRGVLQNFLVKSIPRGPRGLYGLLIASVIFGASHLHHAPVPNWRYAIMATLAGCFYGNAYRNRQRLSSSALTHALVDTAWHFWF